MLFFMFFSGIPITVMVFQLKKLNGHQAFESMTLLATHSNITTHFIILIITNKNSLLFREPSSSVVTFIHLNS